jgi:hypothetical protein
MLFQHLPQKIDDFNRRDAFVVETKNRSGSIVGNKSGPLMPPVGIF